MITYCSPRIGTDEKEFLRVRKIALVNRKALRVVDREGHLLGSFDLQGNWQEQPPKALVCPLVERFCHNVLTLPRNNKRQRRHLVATIGLLSRYEQQLREAA